MDMYLRDMRLSIENRGHLAKRVSFYWKFLAILRMMVNVMSRFTVGVILGVLMVAGLAGGAYFYFARSEASGDETLFSLSEILGVGPREKTPEELEEEALEKSKNIKGLYMTADVASYADAGATRIREHLIHLAETTEINGLVIDVKEVCGADYDEERLKALLKELKEKKIWTIGRIVLSKDASQIDVHPDWYLTRVRGTNSGANECARKAGLRVKRPDGTRSQTNFWRDRRGGYWMDPAHPEVRNYIVDFSKKMIDLGFDELQFDYIRFPSDGDTANAVYPVWNGKTPKYQVMKEYFEYLNNNLKAYKPDIILSADLFGYTALRAGDVGIGQRLDDIGDNFDYVSFMVYPSHYYSGLYLKEDPIHDLPVVNYNVNQARANPDVVIYRSLEFARDFLNGLISTSTLTYITPKISTSSTGTIEEVFTPAPRSKVRIRPWLEDFYHEADAAAGRPSGTRKVRLQIDAAEKVDNAGWLLWSAANVYTEGALKKE